MTTKGDQSMADESEKLRIAKRELARYREALGVIANTTSPSADYAAAVIASVRAARLKRRKAERSRR